MAHNIRNPLTIINNSILELEKNSNANDAKNFQRINTAINRINSHISSILELIKRKPLNINSVELDLVLRSAIKNLSIPKTIKFSKFLDKIIFECDPLQIEHVIQNLLLNSIQEINEYGNIDLKLYLKKDVITIELSDDGKCLSEEQLKLIFEPFYTTKHNQIGLELASCKSIIDAHGGKIRVKNNPKKGITIVIEFPKTYTL